MKYFYILILSFLPLFSAVNTVFDETVREQIKFINLINDDNATQDSILETTKKQKVFYSNLLENIMINKKQYINLNTSRESQTYALEKIINLNKRRGNRYAVIRDEVKIKSYKILDLEHTMMVEILKSLDGNYDEFQDKMARIFTKNHIELEKINNKNYDDILKIVDDSLVIKQVQKTIRDYKSLVEINQDVMKYISIFDKKMYRLNKYSNYKLIKPILYINNIAIVKSINSIISTFNFNVIKLMLILFLIIIVYFIRTIFYNILERYIVKIQSLQHYSKEILDSIKKLVELLIIIINIELVIYVYNDFVTIESVSTVFNIIYGFIFTFIIYRIANAIAKIKVDKISLDKHSIKFEIVNVGIKVINFSIWIIGSLIILFLAGVDLTAVLSGLGIGGFAVALAAKDSLANFFGTLNILFSDMFSQGDWIKIDGVEGTVVEIGLRVTTLRTFDNALISIPNAMVSSKDVRNWNRRSLGRRIKMSIGVKYNSKPKDLKKAIDEIYNMLDKHSGIATANTDFKHSKDRHGLRIVRSKDDAAGVKKTLLVYLDEFGASSINILIYCFSKTVKWSEWLEVKQDVMFKMMEILEENNLEFAFPSMSLYHENNLELPTQKE